VEEVKIAARKVEVRRLGGSLRSAFIVAPGSVDPGGALYALIIVIGGAFRACNCRKIRSWVVIGQSWSA
jgi:hypothetical protein